MKTERKYSECEAYPADGYTVTYTINVAAIDADSAEDAAGEAYRRLTASRGFRAIFDVRDNRTGEASIIDLEHV